MSATSGRHPWPVSVLIVVSISIVIGLAGLIIILAKFFAGLQLTNFIATFSNFVSNLPFINGNAPTLGKILLILGFLILLLHYRTRRAWPELLFSALILFTGLIILTSLITPLKAITQASSKAKAQPGPAQVVFDLPADKIQSDLANVQPNSNILLVLVGDHQVHRYDAMLLDVKGIGSEALTPPYRNKDALVVHISLMRGTNDSAAVEFASLLTSTNSIFLLPSTSTSPTSLIIKSKPEFILPVAKVQSDLRSIQPGNSVALLLVVDHQVYHYEATVLQARGIDNKLLPTPYVNQKASTISISLNTTTDDVIANFVGQLPDASAIYLLPLQ